MQNINRFKIYDYDKCSKCPPSFWEQIKRISVKALCRQTVQSIRNNSPIKLFLWEIKDFISCMNSGPILLEPKAFFPPNSWPNNTLQHFQVGICSDISIKPMNGQHMPINNSYPNHHFDCCLFFYLTQISWIVS